ncbi:TerC/Alx family metal homeostasis membrane protein [Hymenobacter sp. HMF4947]|uniref:TerC/Alx family metal homeostasis membrane protein n=1 Tax=Hymenobacter ginkgonis TaxID=2682976 RepID=A0A7K1TFJ6_9BACT|nr:TerC family protein [Hymenobacter ginkgonis]MVN77180.1 TerC/Alx family metal homeostasis membrane protein [Hymenobacter ginkgonis]
MENTPLFWILFNLLVVGLLLLDLLVFNRRTHAIKLSEALGWSAFWITLSLTFNYLVYRTMGHEAGLQWLAGYLVEKALSVDNLFVFLLIFTYFKVPAEYQHRILFWGVLGALLLRGIFIVAGAALLAKFHFLLYLLGAFLIYTGIRMALSGGEGPEIDPNGNPVVRFLSRHLPITKQLDGGKFFTHREGVRFATPLLVVLVMIETTDVVFAADSIPAILAISRNTFVVYTSNVFALLGLRALYFALASLMQLFHYLSYGLALILVFIGGKLLAEDFLREHFNLELPMPVSLGVVGGLLLGAIAASLLWPKRAAPNED